MAEDMSKSAKKRAAKKARDEKHAEEEAAAAAPPAPAPKAKAAASAPAGGYPTPKAKAKAEPKAAEPAPKAKAKAKAGAAPAPEPASKAKAKAKAEPAPAPEPAPKAKAKAKAEPSPEAAPKAKATAKAKAAAAKAPEPEPKEERVEIVQPFELDDGRGGDWEVSSGLNKKQEKQKQKKEEQAKLIAAIKAQGTTGNRHIAGMTPVNAIPGMGPPQKASGVNQSVGATGAAIAAKIKEEAAASAAALEAAKNAPKEQLFTSTVKVSEKSIGIVIGPKGTKITAIKEKSGVSRIDAADSTFTITGEADKVAIAEQAIKDLATKGYSSLLFEDFSENTVMVAPAFLPDIIGKKGATIIALKDGLGVEIDIPKGEPAPGRKVKLTIAGKKDQAERAKEVINDIMKYGHHEVTHPGEVHEEMDIPSWNYSYIIGTKGSEMRHIQKNFEVRVMIPREGISLNENVVIVGEKRNVERAKAHIEKILYNANQAPKGRGAADKAEDFWGEDGEEEDWMKPYLYKRR